MPSPKLFAQDGDDYREFTDIEYEQMEVDQIAVKAKAKQDAAKAKAKQEILDRLGITAEEAALLLS